MSQHNQDIQTQINKIIDKANTIMLYLNTQGNILTANKKAEEVTGKSKDSLVGKNWLEAIFADSNLVIKQQMFKAILDDSINYKRPNIFEGAIIDTSHSEKIISWNITPILSEAKEVEGVMLLGSDVTVLKEREASLKNIDETLKNIFSSIKEYALYAINLRGNITYYGMGSETMFGWKKSEIAFNHVGMLHSYDDVAYKLPFILEQVKQNGHYELETYLIKKDGYSFPVILNVSQLLDTEGKLNGYIFMAKDITERKKLEYQVFQSEKMAAVGQLAAGMAHEINNPLFVISGRLKMILDNKKIAKKVKDNLLVIDTQTNRIRRLIERYLAFARKTTPNQEDLDINKVIKNVLPLLSYHKLPSHKIHITKDFTKKLPDIRGDSHQLQEVFLNLLINAYQSMPNGGKLNIKTENLNDMYAKITISDTGHGISAQNLKNLFMPFFSTKKDGTGLGLSICYNIIKNHNGNIEVESQVDQGTTFIIKLPFKKNGGENVM